MSTSRLGSPLRSSSHASFRPRREPRFVSVFEILHCLDSATRLEIALAVVSGSRDVSALAALLGLDITMVSRSLSTLAGCGIVEYDGVGAHHLYHVGPALRLDRCGNALRLGVLADDESVVTMDLSPAALKPMSRSLTGNQHEPTDADVAAFLEKIQTTPPSTAQSVPQPTARSTAQTKAKTVPELPTVTTVVRVPAPRGGAATLNHHTNGHGSR